MGPDLPVRRVVVEDQRRRDDLRAGGARPVEGPAAHARRHRNRIIPRLQQSFTASAEVALAAGIPDHSSKSLLAGLRWLAPPSSRADELLTGMRLAGTLVAPCAPGCLVRHPFAVDQPGHELARGTPAAGALKIRSAEIVDGVEQPVDVSLVVVVHETRPDATTGLTDAE